MSDSNVDSMVRAAEQTRLAGRRLFEAGTLIPEPHQSPLALADGLYALEWQGQHALFLVYGKPPVRHTHAIKANIFGGLYSNWYSEIGKPYTPAGWNKPGAILKRCDDALWREVVTEHEADNRAMEDRWADS